MSLETHKKTCYHITISILYDDIVETQHFLENILTQNMTNFTEKMRIANQMGSYFPVFH